MRVGGRRLGARDSARPNPRRIGGTDRSADHNGTGVSVTRRLGIAAGGRLGIAVTRSLRIAIDGRVRIAVAGRVCIAIAIAACRSGPSSAPDAAAADRYAGA
ncbi:MAG TPA: hypothetical protein VHT05_13875 [Candidatus Elarobacter sp.]|nr:hypothetical protein [Candidatus Elarobacter sp.]